MDILEVNDGQMTKRKIAENDTSSSVIKLLTALLIVIAINPATFVRNVNQNFVVDKFTHLRLLVLYHQKYAETLNEENSYVTAKATRSRRHFFICISMHYSEKQKPIVIKRYVLGEYNPEQCQKFVL